MPLAYKNRQQRRAPEGIGIILASAQRSSPRADTVIPSTPGESVDAQAFRPPRGPRADPAGSVLQRLDTPHKIQAYLNGIPQNFEPDGQTALSVREVLRQRRSHCIEGGMLAAAALWVHGERPLLLDLSAENDYDHVVALFRRNGCWGAISKTNHYALRYRDPVYRTLRELAISYFHEYANRRGQDAAPVLAATRSAHARSEGLGDGRQTLGGGRTPRGAPALFPAHRATGTHAAPAR
jgi:hypothetical protein